MKRVIIFIITIIINYNGYSQDTIYKKTDSDYILSKIIEIDNDNIKYKKYSNLEGPLYTISKSKIDRVIYSNGEIEYYSQEKSTTTIEYATIYIIKPNASLNKMTIFQDDKIIGVLSSNTYLTWKIKANIGEVLIISKGEGTDSLRINPIAGKTYYIEQSHKIGWLKGRPKIEFIDESRAKKMLKKAKIATIKYME